MSINEKIDFFQKQVKKEIEKANKKHNNVFFDMYHGYAIILEELEEMWEEIKKKNRFDKLVKEECVHVAAMCIKFLYSFFDENN